MIRHEKVDLNLDITPHSQGDCDLNDADCAQCTVRSRALFAGVKEEDIPKTQGYRDKHCYFSAGDILCREQEDMGFVFTLYSGCLILYNNLLDGNRQILRVAMPGDFIGFDRNSKGGLMYSVQAVSDVRTCAFSHDTIEKMVEEQPAIRRRLIDLQSGNATLCQQRLLNLGQKTAREGLAYLIMELYSRVRVQMPDYFDHKTGVAFFPLNQADMADALGLTKVHINRMVMAFKEEEIIECGHKKLRVLDEEKLSTIGQFDLSLIENPYSHFS